MYLPSLPATPLFLAAILTAAAPAALHARNQDGAGVPPASAPSTPAARTPGDLDAFMERVLARRQLNRRTLDQYVLDETETFEVLGPGRWPIRRTRREYAWYAREDMHVRSPVRFDGVTVDEASRRDYEARWIKREQRRAASASGAGPDAGAQDPPAAVEDLQAGGSTAGEPRFVSEAYFMDFTFEPGNYYLAGREQFEGQEVLRIEYYPTRLFNEADDEKRPREMRRREPRQQQTIDRKMNKTALVTLWVDPREHQIVKYTFDNVWLDFLPGAWLVRVDDIRASMTMGQPFPGVWLPRDIHIRAGVTLAPGAFEAVYRRTFANYRKAGVSTTITVPKTGARLREPAPSAGSPRLQTAAFASRGPRARGRRGGLPGTPLHAAAAASAGARFRGLRPAAVRRSLPAPPPVRIQGTGGGASAAASPVERPGAPEIIREIRVHGNASLTDAEVLALAGLTVGSPADAGMVEAVAKRLRGSGRFETVEVRKRYRSLDDPSDVAIILLVHERPGVRSAAEGGTGRPPSPLRRMAGRLMFFPIVSYADGYGLTYGGRVTAIDPLGAGERLSVPLTWGGTKRAAVEVERTFTSGPLTRVFSSAGVWSRRNPRFGIDERRLAVQGRAERQIARLVRTGVELGRSTVRFGSLDDRLWTAGADAALDTRGDPAFPANAVFLGGGWQTLHVAGRDAVNRYRTDARGYLRVFRQNVLAGRMQYFTADAPLPAYERLLLGGASTLRGFRAGAFDGDRMAIASAELRAPLTSVLRSAKLGLTVFADAGKAVNAGDRLADARWRRGAGAGLFVVAPFVQLNIDVAHGAGAGTRINVGSGFSF